LRCQKSKGIAWDISKNPKHNYYPHKSPQCPGRFKLSTDMYPKTPEPVTNVTIKKIEQKKRKQLVITPYQKNIAVNKGCKRSRRTAPGTVETGYLMENTGNIKTLHDRSPALRSIREKIENSPTKSK
jgi:hypothetical protein